MNNNFKKDNLVIPFNKETFYLFFNAMVFVCMVIFKSYLLKTIMKKLFVAFISIPVFLCQPVSASIRLFASTNALSPSIYLRWNMVNYPGSTAYALFKSEDGVVWTVAAANPVFRNYTAATILQYQDFFAGQPKLYYRVKVYDTNNNIIEFSNTAEIINPNRYYKQTFPQKNNVPAENFNTPEAKNAWKFYPNPVKEIINLEYAGKEKLKGVINVTIQDVTGKIVLRFRAASNNNQLHIPVTNLYRGFYFIKLNISGEVQLNTKFYKQ